MARKNTILLQDGLYKYELPPEPRDEKLIMNYGLPRKEQVWRRPEIKDVKRMSVRERGEYIEAMDEKFWNGMWMFIDGELLYITGMHWDFLQFSKFEFGYPQFLQQQMHDFYFRDLVRKDPNCYGKAILKCRRCGFTAEEIEEAIYTLIEDESNNVGLQSSEFEKCKRTLLHPLIQCYVNRPPWMRGKFYAPNGKKPRNALELLNNKVEVLNNSDTDDYLGGTVLPYPTVASAIDGYKKKLIVMDEAFKWEGCDPEETLGINKKCVVEYGIKGKVDVLSTMGDNDQVLDAVKAGCKIIYDSNPNVRNENNRTTSGLYEWFVSAIHSADIPEEHRDPAYTKFGKINKDRAEAYVRGEVNRHPVGSKQRVFEMRRLPLEKKHGLMAATDKTYFPVLRFQDRLDQLKSLPPSKKPYIRGIITEDLKGKCWFEPNEEGIWLMAVQPYYSEEKGIDTRNRFRNVNGHYYPPMNPEYCIGYDTIKFKKKNTTSQNLSLAAIVVYKKFDYFGSGISNEFSALMLHRPEDPRDAHHECIKACRLFGAPAMIERNVGDADNSFVEANMESFMLKGKDGIWGMYTNAKTTENGVQRLAARFAAPKTPEDRDQVDIYPFEDGIIDFMNFDMNNTESSHATMAHIMCEYGADQLVETNQSESSVVDILRKAREVFPARR